ncbi:MAG: hypothetical protein OXE87_10590 [Chloroflexi bacterium]|nr:hypothetical protein [Chloroflexota bacterium]
MNAATVAAVSAEADVVGVAAIEISGNVKMIVVVSASGLSTPVASPR